jgi:serine/threonine protein kinase
VNKRPEPFEPQKPKTGRKSDRITPTAARSSPGPLLCPGELADRYRIVRLLGKGGMGTVYEVEHVFLQKRFALKLISAISSSDVTLRRFQQEAKAAALLDYPYLVKVHDFGIVNGDQPFFIMDLIEGSTLSSLIAERGRAPLDTVLTIFKQVCLGLDYAHNQGIVHRDIKPSNILITNFDDPTKLKSVVVDFGIAKLGGDERKTMTLTRTGDIVGTPMYMSPEQCMGLETDHRSDIYSLGCVLFESLTGTPPFMADSALATMMKHHSEQPPTLKEATLGETFPESIQQVINKTLAKKPADRYDNLTELAIDLDRIKAGETVQLGGGPHRKQVSRIALRREYLWVGAVVILFVTITSYQVGKMYANVPEFKAEPPNQRGAVTAVLDKLQRINADSLPPNISDDRLTNNVPIMYSSPVPDMPNWRLFAFPSAFSIGTISSPHKTIKDSRNLQQIFTYSKGVFTPLKTANARGVVLVKNFQGLDYKPVDIAFSKPVLLKSFRSDDLLELSMNNHAEYLYDDLQCIAGMTQLEVLDLTDAAALGDRSLATIDSFRDLNVITLPQGNISSERLAKFTKLRSLGDVGLRGINDLNPVLHMLAGSNKVISLELENCKINLESCRLIAQLPRIKYLHIDDDSKVTDSDLMGLKNASNLEELRIHECPKITQSIATFLNLKPLRVMLSGPAWTEEAIMKLQKASPKTQFNRDLKYVHSAQATEDLKRHIDGLF